MFSYAVQTSGRLCLYGENVDWLGGSVVTAVVDLQTEFQVTSLPDTGIVVEYLHDGSVDYWPDQGKEPPTGWLAAAGMQAFGNEAVPVGAKIVVGGALPTSGGLASSAALCTGLAASLRLVRGVPVVPNEIADLAYTAERGLGIPCGPMDQFAIVSGGLSVIHCDTYPPRCRRLPWPASVEIVLGVSPNSMRFTEVLRQLEVHPGGRSHLDGYVTASERAAADFETRADESSLIRLVERGREGIERFLGPLDPQVEGAICAAHAAGAMTAKSSGARSVGGAMFALCEKAFVPAVVAAIGHCGLRAIRVSIRDRGLRWRKCHVA